MKIKPKLAVTFSMMLLCLIGLLVVILTPQKAPTSDQETVELSGYYKNSSGIIDATTKDLIISGSFSEAVANNDYLLINDEKGTLTLVRISDKKTIKIDEDSYAYQLKAIGNDFGYLQERGEAQHVVFLDPETGTSVPLKTENSVITWDAVGADISYHLDETTTLGFAKYDDNLGVTEQVEIDGNIATLSQMFVQEGNSYVWVVANKTENVIYSAETREEVTSNFPVIQKVEQQNGVLAEIVGDYWIITAPVDDSVKLFSQIWDNAGVSVLNMSITGYTFSGDAVQNGRAIYLPVSYTAGKTPDGLLIMNSADHTTDFADKMQSYIRE